MTDPVTDPGDIVLVDEATGLPLTNDDGSAILIAAPGSA